jgi:hypothetical protein
VGSVRCSSIPERSEAAFPVAAACATSLSTSDQVVRRTPGGCRVLPTGTSTRAIGRLPLAFGLQVTGTVGDGPYLYS